MKLLLPIFGRIGHHGDSSTHHTATVAANGALGVSEEGGHLVKVTLSPLVEGVVVTLGAGNVDAEHHLTEIRESIKFHAGISKNESCGRVLSDISFGSDHIDNHLVVGAVGLELVAPPLHVGIHANAIVEVARVQAIHVRKVVEQIRGVSRRQEEIINQCLTLVFPAALGKFEKLFTCRNSSGNIEIDAAHEKIIWKRLIERRKAVCLELLGKQSIDLAC